MRITRVYPLTLYIGTNVNTPMYPRKFHKKLDLLYITATKLEIPAGQIKNK